MQLFKCSTCLHIPTSLWANMTQLDTGFIKDTLICINFLTEKKKLTTLQYVEFRKNGFIKDNETAKSLKSRITL